MGFKYFLLHRRFVCAKAKVREESERESSWEESFGAVCLSLFPVSPSRLKYSRDLAFLLPKAFPDCAFQANAPWSKVVEGKNSLQWPSCCDPFGTGTPPCIKRTI